ncbi:MAG: hypothetical protein OHK0028_19150 [Deltaproteobacteria bacterium]
MSFFQRERDREQLERELGTRECGRLLEDLRCTNSFFRRFASWADVIAFMRTGTSDDPRKDEVLRPILAAHAEEADPRWRTVLLLIFRPGLLSLHSRKRYWDKDPEELWHNITWTFLEVLSRIDVARRPERLVQKIVNDTAHRLHDEYRRIWDRLEREENPGAGSLDSLAARPEEDPYRLCLEREAQELEIRRFRAHVEAGRITEADFHLIVGTRVYGKQIADCAREMGLAYQAARKRRQRAEEAIRRFYEGIGKW